MLRPFFDVCSRSPLLNVVFSLFACAVVEPHGFRHYMKAHFLDPTFKGLYQANAFDMLLLIPYFIVLILLALYGMHRYQLVYLYYKHRKNKVTEPESHFAELPRVTIQLPIFKEQYVIDRLVDCVCKIEYPRDRLQIQVLDDSTDETVAVAAAWSSATPQWDTTSAITIAPIVKAARRARLTLVSRPRPASSSPSSMPTSCLSPNG